MQPCCEKATRAELLLQIQRSSTSSTESFLYLESQLQAEVRRDLHGRGWPITDRWRPQSSLAPAGAIRRRRDRIQKSFERLNTPTYDHIAPYSKTSIVMLYELVGIVSQTVDLSALIIANPRTRSDQARLPKSRSMAHHLRFRDKKRQWKY